MGLGGPGDTLLPPKPAIKTMTQMLTLPPLGVLQRKFNYDPETGILTHRDTQRIAGYTNGRGWLKIKVKDKKYRVHRIVWKIFYGEDPPAGLEIDHINRIRSDNRISNLRAVTRAENHLNRESATTFNKPGYPVILTTPDGIKKEYISINAAARDNKLSSTQLMLVAKGKRRATRGYIAEFI